jgi:chromosome segregation ATPase
MHEKEGCGVQTSAASDEMAKLLSANAELAEAHRAAEEVRRELAEALRATEELQRELALRDTALEERQAVQQQLHAEVERKSQEAAHVKQKLEETELLLAEAGKQRDEEHNEVEKLRQELSDALARLNAKDEASEKSAEAAKQLQAVRKEAAKYQAVLKSRTAELKK